MPGKAVEVARGGVEVPLAGDKVVLLEVEVPIPGVTFVGTTDVAVTTSFTAV